MRLFVSDILLNEAGLGVTIRICMEQRHGTAIEVLLDQDFVSFDDLRPAMRAAVESSFCLVFAIDSDWLERVPRPDEVDTTLSHALAFQALAQARASGVSILLVLYGNVPAPSAEHLPFDLKFLAECDFIAFDPPTKDLEIQLSEEQQLWKSVRDWHRYVTLTDAIIGRFAFVGASSNEIALPATVGSVSRPIRAFISHSSADREWVEPNLVAPLLEKGVQPWYSKKAITAATEWEREILTGLKSCDWLVLVVSARAARSEWVKDELNWAFANRTGRIVPIVMEHHDPWDFHVRLHRIQAIDFSIDPGQGMRELVVTLKRAA
jgi:hypothetical protein